MDGKWATCRARDFLCSNNSKIPISLHFEFPSIVLSLKMKFLGFFFFFFNYPRLHRRSNGRISIPTGDSGHGSSLALHTAQRCLLVAPGVSSTGPTSVFAFVDKARRSSPKSQLVTPSETKVLNLFMRLPQDSNTYLL